MLGKRRMEIHIYGTVCWLSDHTREEPYLKQLVTRPRETSGIPLGGIGAGSVELRPDGGFYDWQEIFQLGSKPIAWPVNRSDVYATTPMPDIPPDALAFVLRTHVADASPQVRLLAMNPNAAQTLYSMSWFKSVEEIRFEQRFPVARLEYVDATLPVSVASEYLSPFVPHDARTAGTPGFYATYRLLNTSDQPVSASILARVRNPIHDGLRDRGLVNRVWVEGHAAFLDMTTSLLSERRPTTGSVSLAASGGEFAWIAGEYRAFMGQGTVVSSPSHGVWHQGLYRGFRDGVAGASAGLERAPSHWLKMSDADVDGMGFEEARALVEELCRMPFAADMKRRVVDATPAALDTVEGLRNLIKAIIAQLSVYGGTDNRMWGDGALIVSVDLEPGEARDIRFAFAWHFPFHYAANEALLGHMYENWFDNAGDVCRYLVHEWDRIVPTVRRFSDSLFRTTLDRVFPNAWSGQLGTLVKSSWWLRNGRFGIWEGLRCCGFHTMDISYQGSFGLVALFPELEKVQMALSALYQREDGRIPHLLAIDLNQVDNDFERVDMNPQFVLLTLRDWLWTGDRDHLERQWPAVVRAMYAMQLLDEDGDGLPDHGTRKNTYDQWNFHGTPSYIASLWLSSFAAAARMATDLGDEKRADAWNALRRKCASSFDRKLWNGEYYSLWVDGDSRDECCMTDQIDGEWFSKMVGLPPGLPRCRILAACDAIMKHNYSEDGGLMNAAYPVSYAGERVYHTFRNVQAEATWTGIEYLFAALLVAFGRMEDARNIVASIEDRHARAGRLWNHLECGDHYYRAMSSWTLLLAASGFVPDVPNSRLTIAPVKTDMTAPWVSSTGWGYLERHKDSLTVACEGGHISFSELRTNVRANSARLNGRALRVMVETADGLAVLRFETPVRIDAGCALSIAKSDRRHPHREGAAG